MQLFGVTAVEFYPNGFIKRIEFKYPTSLDSHDLGQFEKPLMSRDMCAWATPLGRLYLEEAQDVCHCCRGPLDTGSYTIHGNFPAHLCATCFTELVRVGVIKTEG